MVDDEHPTPEQRAEVGRTARRLHPRRGIGAWSPSPDRRPALEILTEQEEARVPELVPLRRERMSASPFAFYRGAAAVMAADQGAAPNSGLVVQLCGDAHLANFGVFASPERSLVFDINDFDETHRGPFEWDLQRLAASFEIAGRHAGLPDPVRSRLVRAVGRSYARSMSELAQLGELELWYARLTVEDIAGRWGGTMSEGVVQRFQRNVERSRGKDRLKALRKMTESADGTRRFLSDPPVLVPMRDLGDANAARLATELVERALALYRSSLAPDRRVLLERYRFVDLARKVVGVGSVGTKCWVALLIGRDEHDPLLLQVKEAGPSVLESVTGPSPYPHHGQRVVEGQRLIQSVGDTLLGWVRLTGLDGRETDYYVRQLWDWKGSADLDQMQGPELAVYAEICAWTLAKAHARTGDSIALSAYVGRGSRLGDMLAAYASAYAEQNDADARAYRQAWTGADA